VLLTIKIFFFQTLKVFFFEQKNVSKIQEIIVSIPSASTKYLLVQKQKIIPLFPFENMTIILLKQILLKIHEIYFKE
jgi:hypothetical protein